MVWYGMVWYGMVWYGMVWCSVEWYGVFFYFFFVWWQFMKLTHVFLIFIEVHEFLQDAVLTFVNLEESSALQYNEAKILFQHLSNINLNEELAKVDETLNTARNLSQFIGNISEEVRFGYINIVES
jgi:hypothetical protein